jgi:LuxR family transcriptional regulator, maltose regulon positive regulatory protein
MSKTDEPLTVHEIKILQRMARGLTNGEIGNELCYSMNTIKSQTYVLFRKLGVSNRVQAVVRGIQVGLIRCPCTMDELDGGH